MAAVRLREPTVQRAYARLEAALEGVRNIRPPNQPLDGFELPSTELVSQWGDSLAGAGRAQLVDAASNIAASTPRLALSEEHSHEHLVIYHAINEVRLSAEELARIALSHGYESKLSIFCDKDLVSDELREINQHLLKLSADVEKLNKQSKLAPLSGIALTLGPIAIPLEALRALLAGALQLASPQAARIDVGTLAIALAAIGRETATLYVEVTGAIARVPQSLSALLAAIRRGGAELSQMGASLLRKVVRGSDAVAGTEDQSQRPRVRTSGAIGIDFGAQRTRLVISSLGVVVNEATLSRPLAARVPPRAPTGRAPASPLREGLVSDEREAALFLEALLNQLPRPGLFGRALAVCSVPARANAVERRALTKAVSRATRARKVHLVDEGVLAALGIEPDDDTATSSPIVLCCRAGSSSAAIVSNGTVVYSASIPTGGFEMDEAIVNYSRRNHNNDITIDQAKSMRETVGQARRVDDEEYIEVVGKDLSLGVPRSIQYGSNNISDAISEPIGKIVDFIRGVIAVLPYELSGLIVERGIRLTGGVALLGGLLAEIRDHTGLHVAVAHEPTRSVANGLQRLLEDRQLLEVVTASVKQGRVERA